MKTTLKSILLCATTAALMLPAMAQTTGNTNSPGIDKREENQQQRIGNGIESGQLTSGEAARLERKEAAINKEEQNMKADGNLSAAERAKLTHQQNVMSRHIYAQKHDAQHQNLNPKSEVGQRERNQQERIAQGVKSGQLNARETARLEGREAHINREVRRDRAANGGTLTQQERRLVNHQQNRNSKAIYRQKHDAQHR